MTIDQGQRLRVLPTAVVTGAAVFPDLSEAGGGVDRAVGGRVSVRGHRRRSLPWIRIKLFMVCRLIGG
ncbi:hypothetical protein ACH47B_26440 [Rhodococcus sp. NPDC019627]|uniref:hypothetical protein n=1 Tax=unclassified Rhodococcus (in: high G+C Gram-positive bacteria) TaxID=192944 RepID=UPI00340E479B